ncbi:hypothetical protein MMC15_001846 [Xylographa vitiligo]|nr:hypothetical protein [Xylographa vitiligo]
MTRPSSTTGTPTGNSTKTRFTTRRRSVVGGVNGITRGSLGQRSTRPNLLSRPSFDRSADAIKRKSTLNGVTNNSKPTDIKRWDGVKRETTTWDYIRRVGFLPLGAPPNQACNQRGTDDRQDPELWFPSGDCLVHFYERGQSRRGASLRLVLADIEASNCRPLLERCCACPVPESPAETVSSSSDDGGYFSNPSSTGKYELYIPAPAHLNREEALQYHLTTRNFFAWMFEKPIVGHRLGDALVSLLDRMNEFRPDPEENLDDLLAYIDNLSYTDFRDCPDHALAILNFAEAFENRELWTDAFVHCSGMNDELVTSTEFMSTSKTTKALITRAHLEMHIRLERAGTSLSNFLEDEVSSSYLALPLDAQKHLERFRSFLTSFYVQKNGYWPPASINNKGSTFPNSTFRAMYFDFRSLYEYLVDPAFTSVMALNRPTAGGIYGLQSISAFDRRYRYATLPNPLALVPEISHLAPARKSGPLARLFTPNTQSKINRRTAFLCALTAATNCSDVKVMESALVREYFRFERETTLKEEEHLSPSDARKVRWLLVYAILQILISVTRAPTEVRDTEGVHYPLCCQIAGTPPWTIGKAPATPNTEPKPTRAPRTPATVPSTPQAHTLPVHPGLRTSGPSTPPPRHLLTRTHSTPTLRASLPAGIVAAHSLAPTISPPSLVVRHPQPRKPFAELLIASYGSDDHADIDEDEASPPPALLGGDGGDSEPETPSSGSGWSAHSAGSEREGGRGPSPSIYDGGEGESEWVRLGRELVAGLEAQRERDGGLGVGGGVKPKGSVGSFAWGRTNPEVESYVGA